MLDSDMQPKPMAETAADATARVSMMECSVTLCSPQRMRAAQVRNRDAQEAISQNPGETWMFRESSVFR
jgi:hypothetical protein